jgi:hypothetical protein
MRVSLVGYGGFAGLPLSASVDTDELPQAQAAKALEALDRLASTPPSIPSGGSSEPWYRLTISRDAEEQVVVVTESQIPPALRPLIGALVRRARPRPPSTPPRPGLP